jgi:hypothetical protein
MALRTWGKAMLAALCVAGLVGASELGVAYGLGIVRFARTFNAGTDNEWNAQLTWVAWFAMVAAVIGASAAARVLRRRGLSSNPVTRVAVSLVAGIGAGAMAPLCMVPARAAHLSGAGNPAIVAGLASGLGAVVGVFAAVLTISVRAAGWNAIAIALIVWLIALLSATPWLGHAEDPLPSIRLGVLDPMSFSYGAKQRLALVSMPAMALLMGVVVAALARLRRRHRLGAAVSGAVGPALLALAYLIALPDASPEHSDQAVARWGALIALGTGLLGSVLVALIGRSDAEPEAVTPGAPLEPTDTIRPVPTDVSPTEENGPRERAGRTARRAARQPKSGQRPEETAARPDARAPVAPPARPAVATRDEEYVGWVSGLGKGYDGAASASGRHHAR